MVCQPGDFEVHRTAAAGQELERIACRDVPASHHARFVNELTRRLKKVTNISHDDRKLRMVSKRWNWKVRSPKNCRSHSERDEDDTPPVAELSCTDDSEISCAEVKIPQELWDDLFERAIVAADGMELDIF
mmetsp:Transcript_7935/g.23892  ORF Transcript_7935/g.23892 Transcript_7935/m.23892 type:complete len:131 (-) Transcript_7935:62-454(-)